MTGELRLERVIDAPTDVVFEAFTTRGGQVAFYGTDDPGWIVESVRPARGRSPRAPPSGTTAAAYYPAGQRFHPGPNYPTGIRKTVRVGANVLVYRVARSAEDAFPARLTYQSVNGRTQRVIRFT